MFYSHVIIRNFKGIKELRLDFDKPPRSNVITLVGLNESGKTTILEALNYFSYGSEKFDPSKLTGYTKPGVHDIIPISKRSNFNDKIEIEFGVHPERDDKNELRKYLSSEHKYRLQSISDEFEITEIYSFKSSKYSEIDSGGFWTLDVKGTTGNQRKARDESAESEIWKSAVNFLKKRLPRIVYFPNFLFDFPDQICIEPSKVEASVRDPKDEFYTTVLQDVLDALDNDATIEDHLVNRFHSNDENDKRSLKALLLEMGRHITTKIFNEWNRIFGKEISGKKVSLYIDKNKQNLACIQFKIEDADGIFDIKDRSLGFRWFFVYLLLTHYRGFRKISEYNLIFLFDEPASNLHSSAQQQLLSSFGRLSQRCRIIYATHSEHLINPLWLESAYVVQNAGLEYDSDNGSHDYNASNTDIKVEKYRSFAVNHPQQRTYFQPILNLLNYIPSKLEAVPHVVMLEGKNDFYSLKLAVLNGVGPSIALLPGTGAGSLDTVIQLYIAWGRQFIILLDSDSEGADQRTRYEEKFGRLVGNRLFLLRDVNADWENLGMESLYNDADRLLIQKTTYPDEDNYSKTHFNRAIQELVATEQSIKISNESCDRLSELLEFLELKLSEQNN